MSARLLRDDGRLRARLLHLSRQVAGGAIEPGSEMRVAVCAGGVLGRGRVAGPEQPLDAPGPNHPGIRAGPSGRMAATRTAGAAGEYRQSPAQCGPAIGAADGCLFGSGSPLGGIPPAAAGTRATPADAGSPVA